MTYKKIAVNRLSGPRLKKEIETKFGKRKNAYFAKIVGIEEVTLSYICNGKRALTRDRAEQFGKILGVRPEYLLGTDDFRTYDREWAKEAFNIEEKKEIFFKHCLSFWGYEIIETISKEKLNIVSKDILDTIGFVFRIRKPSGEIIEIDDSKQTQIQDEILDFVKYKLDTNL